MTDQQAAPPDETPAETPTQTTAETPAEMPTQTTAETPAETAVGTPAETAAGTPAETAAGTPARPSLGRIAIQSVIEGNSVVVTTLSIVAAIVVGGLLIAFTDPPVLHAWASLFAAPGNAFAQAWDAASSAYVAMFEGAVVNPHALGTLFQQKSASVAFSDGAVTDVLAPLSATAVNATPLIFAGLAVAVAFRAGLFNIGGQSQFIGGAIVATWLGFGVSLPPFVHVVVCVLGAVVGGAAIGAIPGLLKATTGAHEVIVTIMLNYVAMYFLAWILGTSAMQRPGRTDLISPFIAGDAHLPQLLGSHLQVNASFLIAIGCAVAVAWLLNRSTIGFEFRSVGANQSAARSAGMSVQRTWIVAFLIAGGLAGLAASAVVQGTDFTLTFQSYGTYGIDAITVALLGRARPLGVVLAALLFGALHAGGTLMQGITSTPLSITEVIQALIVLFVAAPPLIRALFRLHKATAGGQGQSLAKGWNG